MPFQSEKQRRFLHANHPEIAKRWESDYANGGISNHFRRKYFSGAYGQGAGDRGGDPHASRAENVASSFTSVGKGGNNNNNNTPPTHPIHTGPTVAELAARKAAAEAKAAAEKKAIADAQHSEWITKTKKDRTKKVKYRKDRFDTGEWDETHYGLTFDDLTKDSNQLALEDFIKTINEKGGVEPEDFGLEPPSAPINLLKYKNVAESDFSDIEGQLAKVYNKKDLENIDANWAGWGLGANNKLEAMENLLQGVKKLQKTTLGSTLTLQEAKEEVIERGNQLGTGYKKVDADLVPKDFLETEADLKTQKSPYKLFDKAKGGLARKNYFHGGILDINESEEIISDDGNDIELTDYNAAFDDPNDLSTGVKSLFRAKDGGTPQLAQKSKSGKRPGYAGNPFGYSDTPAHHGDVAHGDQGRFNQPSAPVQTQTVTAPKDGPTIPIGGGADFGTIPDEKGNVNLDLVDRVENEQRETEMLNLIRRHQLDKGPVEYYGTNWPDPRDPTNKVNKDQLNLITKIKDKIEGDWKRYIDPSAWDTIKRMYAMTSFSGIIKEVFKGIKRKKDMNAFMQDLKDLGLAGGPPGTNDPLYDQLWLHLEKQKRDDEGLGADDMPKPIYDPTTGAVSEEYAQAQGQYGYPNSNLDQIRAGQAKYADYMEKIEREKAMFANSGGLANLFRVKNQ